MNTLRSHIVLLRCFWINIFLLSATTIFAQLSGIYTVNPSKPAGGTNYSSIAGITNALYDLGVKGPVVVNIADGTYNEQLSLTYVKGTSATNTITFQSASHDSSKVIINSTGVSNPIQLSASYLTIYQLSFINKTSYNYVAYLSGCYNVTITNCRITAGANQAGISISGYCGAINIINNDISAASTGITTYLHNDTLHAITIKGNNIHGCISGMYFNMVSGIDISFNHISCLGGSNGGFGIDIASAGSDIAVYDNMINISGGGTGLFLNNIHAGKGHSVKAYNNMIKASGDNRMVESGINVNGCDLVYLYFNNILTAGKPSYSAVPIIIAASSSATKTVVYNNVLQNNTGGECLNFSSVSNILDADYNDYYTTGTYLAVWNNKSYSKLSAWSNDLETDRNSLNAMPGFKNDSDLHERNFLLYRKGHAIPGIVSDIDGEGRNATQPSIGADEFLPVHNDVAVNMNLSYTSGYVCGDSTQPRIVVTNFGDWEQDNIPVAVSINGIVKLQDTIKRIPAGRTDTFVFRQTLNTLEGGKMRLKFYTAAKADADRANDTLMVNMYSYPTPGKLPDVTRYFCKMNIGAYLGEPHGNDDRLYWYNNNNTLIGVKDDLYITVNGDADYSVRVKRNFAVNTGLKDTASSGGRFSTRPVGMLLNLNIPMILDTITVYPRSSGSFYLSIPEISLKFKKITLSVSHAGEAVKVPLNIQLPNGNVSLFIDTISTGGLYCNLFPAGNALSDDLVSVSQTAGDSLYRYFYDIKLSAQPPCLSVPGAFHIIDKPLSPYYMVPTGGDTLSTGNFTNPIRTCGSTADFIIGSNYADSLYGKVWEIKSSTAKAYVTGNPTYPLTYSPPSGSSHALLHFRATLSEASVLVQVFLTLHHKLSGCDSTISWYVLAKGATAVITNKKWTTCSSTLFFTSNINGAPAINWDFGDGDTSAEPSPQHTFQAGQDSAKHYLIKLSATSDAGCISTDTMALTVYGIPYPYFHYTTDSLGHATFIADSQHYKRYDWTFGDLTKKTGPDSINHTYSRQGLFLVQLTATNKGGCTASAVRAVLVTNTAINTPDAPLASLNIFPNPSQGRFLLNFSLTSPSMISLSVNDLRGRTLCTLLHESPFAQGNTSLPVTLPASVTPGTYMLQITVNGIPLQRKIVVQ